MKSNLYFVGFIAVAISLLCCSLPARCETFAYLKSWTYTPTLSEQDTGYKVEYSQVLYQKVSFAFDYVNEGHFSGHHRDGYGLELRYAIPVTLFAHPVVLSLGAGPQYYFDTITPLGGASIDAHGLAPRFTAGASGRLWRRLNWLVAIDAITPSHDIKDYLVSAGLGYKLGANSADKPDLFTSWKDGSDAIPIEVSLFSAFSVINISGNPNSWGGSVELRLPLARHIEFSSSYIYEGDPKVARRSGVTAQLWPIRSDEFSGVEIGAGFGVYVFVDKKSNVPGQAQSAVIAPLMSIVLSWPASSTWFGRFIWDRVVSNYNRDADIWRLGFGRRLR